MQVKELKEDDKTPNNSEDGNEESEKVNNLEQLNVDLVGKGEDSDKSIDFSGKSLELSNLKSVGEDVEGLYVYKNVFNLMPKVVGGMKKLKRLKFFSNEVNLFSEDDGGLGGLVDLECLQVKVGSWPGLSGLEIGKLEGLKELELSKVPPRLSGFQILSEIGGLKKLTKLSVCHFSIRYLPPEIGFLENLEQLDLSFNKMRRLPSEISSLKSLISLKISNNKLVELPPGLTKLQNLENLDLSNNKLTSLGNLELGAMHNLQRLNLQCNRLLTYCQIPSWICCNLEGNGKDMSNDEFISSSVEMDIRESDMNETCARPQYGSSVTSPSHSSELSSSSRCFATKKFKGWKRRNCVQQRARQERLNDSRWRGESEAATQRSHKKCKVCKQNSYPCHLLAEDSLGASSSDIITDESFSVDVVCEKSVISSKGEGGSLKEDSCVYKCSCDKTDSPDNSKDDTDESTQCDESLDVHSSTVVLQDEGSASEEPSSIPKAKRHFDGEHDNPKPSKYRRPECTCLNLSCKYNKISFCGIDDHLVDGFYDAGRDRPFMELQKYKRNLHLDSREVILVDRKKDEGLDAITVRAQAMISGFKQMGCSTEPKGRPVIDDLQIASLLSLFVSDHFGGSDKTAAIQQTRKLASGSNYRKPFVCTCRSGNIDSASDLRHCSNKVEDIMFRDLCERSLQSIKARCNSIVVPIGSLQFGVCRHRALLMKYLCDRMEPPIPCELVRGYLDFSPHAWNVVIVKRNQAWVRMIVDACSPHDIREEMDQEYFSRYIPLNRINVPLLDSDPGPSSSFPSVSLFEEIGKVASSTLMRCKFGGFETAAKVRSLDVHGATMDEIRNFELNCLGEVRMLALLKHPCIVELYGHQISSKWVPSDDAVGPRVLQSTILMDYVKGGSLKSYLQELVKNGKKRVAVHLALCIARDVACAIRELHSKHIIHRDIKSENIVIDLNTKRADGTPVVKLCDFDRAIPLRSYLHTCCIAHFGIPPPDACVGTPRWMAPEVYLTMHNRNVYGLEVDIWSFGCLLLELLTLEIPYTALSDSEINSSLQLGKRPRLTEELEELVQPDRELDTLVEAPSTEGETPEVEHQTLRLLANIYHRCTHKNPSDRPTAEKLYDVLLSQTTSISTSGESEQE